MNDIYLIRHTTPAVARGICYGQTDLDVTATFMQEVDVIRGHLPSGFSRIYSSPLQRCARLAQELFPGHELLLRDSLMEVNCGEWEMMAWDDIPKEEVNPWMEDFVNIRTPGGESYLDLHSRVTACWDEVLQAASGQSAAATSFRAGAAHIGAAAETHAHAGDAAPRTTAADYSHADVAASGDADAATPRTTAADYSHADVAASGDADAAAPRTTAADYSYADVAASGDADAAAPRTAGEALNGPIAVVAHGGVIRSLLSGLTGTPLIDSFKAFSLYYGCVIRITEGKYHEILSNIMPPEWEQHKPSSYYKK